jgi:acyl carrier protein
MSMENGSVQKAGEMKGWLVAWLAEEMAIDAATVDPSQPFLSFGMNSVQAMTLVGDLETKLSLRLPPTLAWDYPDINTLSAHLAERIGGGEKSAGAAPHAPAAAPESIESLLASVDQLSDDAVEALLSQLQN